MIIHLLSLLALATAVSDCSLVAHLAECSTHTYSEEVSKQLASSIKIRLVQEIEKISNQTLSKALLADLFQENDSKRHLTSIDTKSAQEIFAIFNLKAPQCDKDNNGAIEGRELKCFNKIWKYFIPDDEYW